jgi:hypothetical protein
VVLELKYQISKENVALLKGFIDVNLKNSGLEIFNAASTIISKLQIVPSDDNVVIDFEESDLKMIDSFLDGALRQLGLQALNGVNRIIEAFRFGAIQLESIEAEVEETQE